jgi:hypothetical protein
MGRLQRVWHAPTGRDPVEDPVQPVEAGSTGWVKPVQPVEHEDAKQHAVFAILGGKMHRKASNRRGKRWN